MPSGFEANRVVWYIAELQAPALTEQLQHLLLRVPAPGGTIGFSTTTTMPMRYCSDLEPLWC